MIRLGLTGSIGMGKSATAAMFRAAGVLVHDADATVHTLYRGAAAGAIEAAFPGTTRAGVVDREALAGRVLGDAGAVRRLEAIVHPMVRAAEIAFLERAAGLAAPLVVLDIPLLFETGAEVRVDVVVTVSAPAGVQRGRVLARPGMTAAKFEAILARQLPDAEKRRRAHFVVDTARGFDAARLQVDAILRALRGMTRPRPDASA